MLSWRTSLLLSLLPIGLVAALVLTQHGAPAAKPLPRLPNRAQIASAQAFFDRAEHVCYGSWGQLRRLKIRRVDEIRPVAERIVGIHQRMVRRLEALGSPPPRAARRFRRGLALLRARNTALRRALALFEPGAIARMSPGAVRRELSRIASRGRTIDRRLDKVAPSMGLWKCRK
jgi:hypothetical protein